MMDWWQFFVEPFSHLFMQRTLVVAIMMGTICAILSCFLVLKGWSLMGDAISHAVLPGIIIAYWLKLPLAIGAFFSGLFCSTAAGFLKKNSRIKEDTILGIVFSGMFALGLVLFSKTRTNQHLMHIFFGNILGVTNIELLQTTIITLISLVWIAFKYRDFVLYCFDPQYCQLIGLPYKTLHYSLLCLLALSIVASLQAVGVVLVIAMLIAPGITAFVVCRQFNHMLYVAISVTIFSCLLGILLSYHIDGSTGPCIVITQAFCFIVAQLYALSKKRFRIQQQI